MESGDGLCAAIIAVKLAAAVAHRPEAGLSPPEEIGRMAGLEGFEP